MMTMSLAAAWTETLGRMLGGADWSGDQEIMAAQLERAVKILARPPIASGSLFETEPASFDATLDRLAPGADR